ncbi:MAG: DUF3570 domain-containing protein [Nitrospiria bacterium]
MRMRAVTRRVVRSALSALIVLIFFSAALAQTVEDEVAFRYHFYEDSSGLTVKTPYLILKKQITPKTSVALRYAYETFEIDPKKAAASAGGGGGGGGEHDHGKTAPQKVLMAVDAVSGASAVAQSAAGLSTEVRQEVVTSLSHRRGETTFGGTYAFSDEDDYRSHAVALSLSRDFFLRNTNLTAQYYRAQDEVDNLDRQPGETDWPRDKEAQGGTLVLTQILSPKSFIRLGYGLSDASGYLAGPYRRVVINATRFEEIHPDNRLRQTFFAWLNRYFETRTSAHLNGVYYRDDWGVRAQAAELKLYQYLGDPLILRLRYRHYEQSKADFFDPNRSTTTPIMSADPKLRDFDMRLYGLKFIFRIWERPLSILKRANLELGYDRLEEPEDFHADITQFALRLIF